VWDALAAPLLTLDSKRARVLLLGLGGGSVARVVRALLPGARIVAVEKDREVVSVARRRLGLGALGLEIVMDDALHYLRRERRLFDAVIEDLMVGTNRTVRKPDGLVERYDLVARRVSRGGVLVVNTIHETPRMVRVLEARRGTLVSLAVRGYYNRILALGPRSLRAPALRARLGAHPLLAPALTVLSLRTLKG
jgi:spermidine synthase